MGEQVSIFDNSEEYKKIHQRMGDLLAEINSYDIQMQGLQMSRDSALAQLYDLIIAIPMDDRRKFTKKCMPDEQIVMVEAIAKHAAQAYIYGAKPKGGDSGAQISVR